MSRDFVVMAPNSRLSYLKSTILTEASNLVMDSELAQILKVSCIVPLCQQMVSYFV
jgi:hypothetical protein